LDTYYDVFLCAFPEYKYKYILIEGFFFLLEKDVCYQIKNMSKSDYFGFYMFLEIEWFYENVYIVSHEIEKLYNSIQNKTEKLYESFMPQYKSLGHDSNSEKIDQVWEHYNKFLHLSDKSRLLFLNLCKLENKTIHDIQYNEKIFDSDDLMFNETVKRSYQKKKLNEQLDQLLHLRKQCIEKSVFYHCYIWKLLIRFLVLLSKFTKLQIDFQNMIFEIESLLPKIRIFDEV
jgi:hypothetical protein